MALINVFITPEDALIKAVKVLGGQTQMAEAIGEPVKQQHVWGWLNRGGRLPPEYARKVEEATRQKGDTVTAAELCPKVFCDLTQSA